MMAVTWASLTATALGSLLLPPIPRCPHPRCQQPTEATTSADAALAFGAALSAAWGKGDFSALKSTLRVDCVVETPLWQCDDRAAYESELAESRNFFSSLSRPALTVLSNRPMGDGRAQLTWVLGVEWPAVWRPRVNILGESILTIAPGGSVTRVDERWHQKPIEAFTSQVLPRFRDIASVYCTPTAEHLPLPIIGGGNGYELKRVPPMLALQSEWIEVGDLVYAEQAPLPPFFAFNGEVKRADWYNTISPGLLERSFIRRELPGGMTQIGQRRRWFCALPTRFASMEISDLPDLSVDARGKPHIQRLGGESSEERSAGGAASSESAGEGEGDDSSVVVGGSFDDDDDEGYESLPSEVVSTSVQYVRRPSQLLAVKRLRKIPSNDNVITTALELAKAAESDGYRVIKREGRPVIMQLSTDLKYGFNDEMKLSMAVWLSVPDPLREEYVGVIIDEGGAYE